MKNIPLTKGLVALVDDSDYPEVSKHKWYACKGYARRDTWRGGRTVIYLHAFLSPPPAGKITDHIDGNPLNCSRSNLRHVDHRQNVMNSRKSRRESPYKGVHINRNPKLKKKWRARIVVNGKLVSLGAFYNPVDAAKAYDVAAKRFFGPYARPNFV